LDRIHIEERVGRIERLLGQAQEEVAKLRQDMGVPLSADERWARMMLGVLEDIDRRGGSVPREEVLSIGERHGYSRRGMAGFYQGMLRLEAGMAKLTDAGRVRIGALRRNYGDTDQA
jgi:hypothetical protein